jgi:hypothetical protein
MRRLVLLCQNEIPQQRDRKSSRSVVGWLPHVASICASLRHSMHLQQALWSAPVPLKVREREALTSMFISMCLSSVCCPCLILALELPLPAYLSAERILSTGACPLVFDLMFPRSYSPRSYYHSDVAALSIPISMVFISYWFAWRNLLREIYLPSIKS